MAYIDLLAPTPTQVVLVQQSNCKHNMSQLYNLIYPDEIIHHSFVPSGRLWIHWTCTLIMMNLAARNSLNQISLSQYLKDANLKSELPAPLPPKDSLVSWLICQIRNAPVGKQQRVNRF